MGDININVSDVHSNHVQKYLELLNTYNLTQTIETPTRVSLTSLIIIDHIIVSDASLVTSSLSDLNHNISDHGVLSCELNVSGTRKESKFIEYRCFKKFDRKVFLQNLQYVRWDRVYELANFDDKISFFNNELMSVVELHAPIVRRKLRNHGRSGSLIICVL